MQDERTVVVHRASELVGLPTRRGFLKALAAGGSLVLMPSVFAACDDNNTVTGTRTTAAQTISLSSDVGIFQFAYVLEQLESTFYEQLAMLSNFSTLFTADERELLTDIRNDEVAHREFLRVALGGSIPDLTFNFNALGTITKANALTTALTLETNGIAAYNGAGRLLKNARNLLVAGKIVSVEARHTSAIADAIDIAGISGATNGQRYADLMAVPANLGADNANALDAAVPSSLAGANVVATNAQQFIVNPITLTA